MRGSLVASLMIGVVDYCGLLFGSRVFSDAMYVAWVVTALVLWIALFGFGIYRWRLRFLWSLLGLPLILLSFLALIAGSI